MTRSEKEPFAMTKIFWYNFLTCKFANYVHEFYNNNNFPQKPIDYDMSIQVLRYQETGHYITHVDYSKHAPRQFSFSYILNDDYKGGEFEFHLPRNEVLKIKPKANSCIMFPSNFAFAHKVNPVSKGTRYAVVGWMP
jgi:Rps23 Pro-64 3,4-dihydroxylase Tpa1-like proline 4-hydroxylase